VHIARGDECQELDCGILARLSCYHIDVFSCVR